MAPLTEVERSGVREFIFQDWAANPNAPRIRLGLVFFRAAQLCRTRFGRGNPLSLAAATWHRFFSEVILGFELPVNVHVGRGLVIFHGFGLVVHPDSKLGKSVILRQNVTIGNRIPGGSCPTVGNDVEIGAGATILGGVVIGDGASVGPHALVLEDVPPGGRARAARALIRPDTH